MKFKKLLSGIFGFVFVLLISTVFAIQTPAIAEEIDSNANSTYVAKIGDTEYATLQEAIDAAQDGDKIIVDANVELTVKDHAVNGATIYTASGEEVAVRSDEEITLISDTAEVVPTMQARIGDAYYTTLQEAINVAQNGDTITVNTDIALTDGLTIPARKSITLDLNGKTISGDCDANQGMITVENTATLTITDSSDPSTGKIIYTANASDVGSALHVKGNLVLNSGTIELAGTWNIGFAVDVRPNSWGTAYTEGTTFVMNGGTIKSSDSAVRVASTSDSAHMNVSASFKMNGGTIESVWDAIFIQHWVSCDLDVEITGGSVTGTNSALRIYGETAVNNIDLTVSGGAFKGEIKNLGVTGNGKTVITGGTFSSTGDTFSDDVSDFVAEGYKIENNNGTYGVKAVSYVAQIDETKYETLEEAIKAVPKNVDTTIQLLCDYTIASTMVGHQYVQNITIDLGGHTLSNNSIVLTAYRSGTILTIQNGTVKGNASTGTLRATYGGKIILGEGLTVAGAGGSAILIYIDNGSVEIAADAAEGVTFTGGKQDFKQSENVNNEINVDASIGRTYFGTLANAFAAAEDGDTVTVQNDVSLTKDNAVKNASGYDVLLNVAGKSITLDMNEKTISVVHTATEEANRLYAVICVEDGAGLTVTGNGTIDVTTDETTPRVAYMFWKRGTTGSLTIENGTFHMNDSEDSIVYTNGSQIVSIMGGDFRLDRTGTRANGSPWIFNAQGQNERHIKVYGGTFNADVLHQYWIFEAQYYYDDINNFKALVKGEDGIYSFVDAVAYVTDRYYSGNWYTLETGYATLEEAIAACDGPKTKSKKTSEQEEIILLKDITLESAIEIPEGKTVVLDLNGKKITMESEEAISMIVNKGSLTIKGDGESTIAYTFKGEINDSVAANTIKNTGILVVNGGTIKNTGIGNQIGYAIDNRNGSTLTVNGGKITAAGSGYYDGIRLMCGNEETIVTVNGGEISSIWAQNPSANKATKVQGTVVMTGGTVVGKIYYENYTTVKVKNDVTVTVAHYGVGTENKDDDVDGYDVYSAEYNSNDNSSN